MYHEKKSINSSQAAVRKCSSKYAFLIFTKFTGNNVSARASLFNKVAGLKNKNSGIGVLL